MEKEDKCCHRLVNMLYKFAQKLNRLLCLWHLFLKTFKKIWTIKIYLKIKRIIVITYKIEMADGQTM